MSKKDRSGDNHEGLLVLVSVQYLCVVFLIAIIPASLFVAFKAVMISLLFVFTFGALVGRTRFFSLYDQVSVSVLAYLIVIVGLSLYTLYVGAVETNSILSAASRYLVVVVLVFIGHILIKSRLLSLAIILKTIFLGHFGYMAMKVIALLAARFMGLDSDEITEYALIVSPGATVHGFSDDRGFVRIFLGNDAIAPFLLGIYLFSIHHGIIRRASWGDYFVMLTFIVATLTFTRFVWLSTLGVIGLFSILYLRELSQITILKWVFQVGLAILITLYIMGYIGEYSNGLGNSMMSERMGDNLSLDEKLLQVELMWQAFVSSPYIGTGVGSHLAHHLRPDELKFQYEVQWFALLMQLGALGFLAIACIATAPLWRIFKGAKGGLCFRDFFFIASIYGVWLLGAFTNPYLFISSSVLVYLGVLVISESAASADDKRKHTLL